MRKHLPNIKLFGSGFIQVILVAINTYQIANNKILGTVIFGFLISFVWSFNVRKIAFGTMTDRIVYALGAAGGSATGLVIATQYYT